MNLEIHLEPNGGHYSEDDLYTNGLIRIAYARGNEKLVNQYGYEIGGRILNAGVVFMPIGTPRDLWTYVSSWAQPVDAYLKQFRFKQTKPNYEHYGNKFHDFSVTWTDSFIEFAVDGEVFGTSYDAYKETEIGRNRYEWFPGGRNAPFDREFHIALSVAVGGFADFPDNSLSGEGRNQYAKPWVDLDPKAEAHFVQEKDQPIRSWSSEDSQMIIESVKAYAI